MRPPLIYDPSFEQPAPDEAETTAALIETMRGISETTFHDYGHAVRSVHAKSHALLHGEMRVLDGLPPHLAYGAFAQPGTRRVVMRFSTIPGDILDDSVSAPRGLAIKIVGVEGGRLPGSEGEVTQDFIFVNGPAFAAPTPKAFLSNLKLLAKTTDTPQGWKKAFSATLRVAEAALESLGGKSGLLTTLGGQPLTNILGDTYYTQVPVLYGPHIAKLSVVPVSPNLTKLTGEKVDVHGKPNALRDAATSFFGGQTGEWEIRVQLCTDLEKMPIEDASVVWPEDESPYVPVARLVVAAQPAWNDALAAEIDDGMAFSPWHGLAAHRPVGGVQRVRKPTYESSATFRGQHNGCPIHEPRALDPTAA